jgi:DNA-binding CsgD family transcriptional regulator
LGLRESPIEGLSGDQSGRREVAVHWVGYPSEPATVGMHDEDLVGGGPGLLFDLGAGRYVLFASSSVRQSPEASDGLQWGDNPSRRAPHRGIELRFVRCERIVTRHVGRGVGGSGGGWSGVYDRFVALYDREVECALIDRSLDDARAGRSVVVVLRGDAGLGKSSLIEHAVARGNGMRVLACCGFEAESQLAFAGLGDLLRPLAGALDVLPDRQRAAVEGALSLGPSAAADRLTLYVGVLGLLAAVAESQPLLITVDDAHWLDAASADALAFTARRIEADRIAILVAVRRGEGAAFGAGGFRTLDLSPIGPLAARRLLDEAGNSTADEADRVIALAGGNPLAVIELAKSVAGGRVPLDQGTLPAGRVQDAFLRRVAALPPPTRQALLVAAAADGDALLLGRALAAQKLELAQLEPAEAAGLVALGDGRVWFTHPLARAAIYAEASPAKRRGAHAAIAAGLVEPQYADARAWHLAGAAVEPDEEVADALARSAERARANGGYATAVDVLRRAAALSPLPADRSRRLRVAAEVAYRGGDTAGARLLIDSASESVIDMAGMAAIEHLRGRVEARGGSPSLAYELFCSAADRMQATTRVDAALSLVEAVEQCIRAGLPARGLETADRSIALIDEPLSAAGVFATLGRAAACIFLGDSTTASELIAVAVGAADAAALDDQIRAYLGLLLAFDEQLDPARAVLTPLIHQARGLSAMGQLVFPLISLGWVDRALGRWPQATAGLSEAAQIAAETGRANDECWALSVLAWIEGVRGQREACTRHCSRQFELHQMLGLPYQLSAAEATLGLLALGAGSVGEAVSHLERALATKREHGYCDATSQPRVTPDLVEAYARTGQPEAARRVFDTFEAEARTSGRPSALALAAGCEGMLEPNNDFEPALTSALAYHADAADPFARARTELCFGELLRRGRQRERSRQVLRSALDTFEALGAEPWAERATTELRASGARLRRRDDPMSSDLTPQEWQIAALVAEGLSNKDVAARAIISPKTVEAHLTRIYAKLGVHSRTGLAKILPGIQRPDDEPRDRPTTA